MREPGARRAQGHQESSGWFVKMFRWAWRVTAVSLLGITFVFLLLKIGLSLGILRHWFDKTASEIAKFPIRVQGCNLALWGSSLVEGIDVFEARGSNPEPWLKIHSLEADVSLENLALGNIAPKKVVAINPVVNIEFDENNDLVTRLPRPEDYPPGNKMPRLILKDAEFQLKHGKRPPLKVRNIQGEAWRDEKNNLVFEATSKDPNWGDWSLKAKIEPGDGDSLLVLNSNRVDVTQTMLDSVPFVPDSVWRHVKLNGVTDVDIQLFFDGKKGGCQYKLELAPRQTRVRVETIKLEAENAQGKVHIQDGLIQLRDIKGDLANGIIELTSGDLDFRDKLYLMDYDLKVKGVQIQNLPYDWGRGLRDKNGNSFVQGLLDGWAKLRLKEDPLLGVRTSGSGKGIIEAAKFLGFPTKPIPLEIKADGSRFRFNPLSALPGLLPTSSRKPDEKNLADQHFLETQIEMEIESAGEFARRMGWKLPVPLNGKLSLELGFQAPLKTVTDPITYTGKLQAKMSEGSFGSILIPESKFSATLLQGEVLVPDFMMKIQEKDSKELAARQAPGEIHAGIKLDLLKNLEMHTRAQASSIPSGIITPWIGEFFQKMQGRISFGLESLGELDSTRFHAWRGNALFRWDNWQYETFVFPEVHGKIQLAKGNLELAEVKGQAPWGKLEMDSVVSMENGFPFETKLKGQQLELKKIAREFYPPISDFGVEGLADATATIHGGGNRPKFRANASIHAAKVAIGKTPVEQITSNIVFDDRGVEIKLARGNVLGAGCEITGLIPVQATQSGNLSVKVTELDLGETVKSLLEKASWVHGKVSANADILIMPQNLRGERNYEVNLQTGNDSFDILDLPFSKVVSKAKWSKNSVAFAMETNVAGGNGKLDLKYDGGQKTLLPGHLIVEKASLKPVLKALDVNDNLQLLDGEWSLDLPFNFDLDCFLMSANGIVEIDQLKHGKNPLSEQIKSTVVMNNHEITFKDIQGTLGDGQLRASAELNLNNPERNKYKATLTKAEMAKLFAPWLAFMKPAGKIDIRAQGKIGREITSTGEGVSGSARVFGMEVGDWRIPFDMVFAPARGAGSLVLRDVSGSVAQGKISGSTEYRWGVGSSLQGNYRFQSLDFRTVQAQLGDSPSQAAGTIQGKLQFSGRDVKSLDQLSASLDGTLVHSRAQGIPIVRDLVPFLPVAATGAFFDRGELKARMDRGVIRVNRLSMSNALMMVLIEGTISLQGKLDMEATARTGNLSVLPESMRNMGLRMPAIGAVPLEMISQVTNTLAAGILHFKIQGTYKDPIVRSVPLTLLTEEALRFFLGR